MFDVLCNVAVLFNLLVLFKYILLHYVRVKSKAHTRRKQHVGKGTDNPPRCTKTTYVDGSYDQAFNVQHILTGQKK